MIIPRSLTSKWKLLDKKDVASTKQIDDAFKDKHATLHFEERDSQMDERDFGMDLAEYQLDASLEDAFGERDS